MGSLSPAIASRVGVGLGVKGGQVGLIITHPLSDNYPPPCLHKVRANPQIFWCFWTHYYTETYIVHLTKCHLRFRILTRSFFPDHPGCVQLEVIAIHPGLLNFQSAIGMHVSWSNVYERGFHPRPARDEKSPKGE